MNFHSDSDSELIFVEESEVGERLDKLLTARFQGRYSRTYFQSLIDEGLVLVNGLPVKKREKFEKGAEVEICFKIFPSAEDVIPEAIPLDILYEDTEILVINKRQGIVVHPAAGHFTGTLVNALLYHHQGSPYESEGLRPGIVHRLDKETSGVLVTAKTREAHAHLVEEFATRQVKKEYLAVVSGNPGQGEVIAPIGRDPEDRKKMSVVTQGKEAHTLFKTLEMKESMITVTGPSLTRETFISAPKIPVATFPYPFFISLTNSL